MKKTLLFFTSALFSLGITAQIPTTGLVAYWSFAGNASDNSGNGHNGTVKGATLTSDRFGRINNAYEFDGTDTIQVDLQQTNITAYSVSAWFKTTYGGAILAGRGLSGQNGLTLVLHTTGGIHNGKVMFVADGGAISIGQLTDSTFFDNQWHHVVGVFDGANGAIGASQFKIYLDNVLVAQTASNSGSANAPINNGTDLMIGAHQVWGSPALFNGTLDDYRIYDRAITTNEVSALYNESLCVSSVSVTDTLVINLNITGFNPVVYNNAIKIYPNPAVDQLNISIGNYNSINGYQLKIINQLSQVMYQQVISGTTYSTSLSGFSAGTYFVQVYDTNSNLLEVRKLILQ